MERLIGIANVLFVVKQKLFKHHILKMVELKLADVDVDIKLINK